MALAEEAAMRIWMAACTVGTMLAGASGVSAAEVLGSPAALTITIHVTDKPNLSSIGSHVGGHAAAGGVEDNLIWGY